MKKVIIILTILLLAGFILAGSFYFSNYSKGYPNKKVIINSVAQPVIENKKTEVVPAVAETESKKSAKILFLGDLMFDRYIRQTASAKGNDFIFQKVANILSGNDLVVANLEGPVTSSDSISVNSEFGARNNYIFTFDKSLLPTLKKYNIDLVSIGNNHILNFKESGLDETRSNLKGAGIDYFGDPKVENNFAIEKIGGWKVAFVNYDQFIPNGGARTLTQIKSAKTALADLVIVYAHWDREYALTPAEKTKELAHNFIDAGTDLIIGSHPHVVQSQEIYKGKKIYYSLGNFIFDQYFNPETMKGLAVEVTIDAGKKLNFKDYALKLEKNGQTISQ